MNILFNDLSTTDFLLFLILFCNFMRTMLDFIKLFHLKKDERRRWFMNQSIQHLLESFGLLPDTATMTLGDGLVYMVMVFFAIISIYLLYSFVYNLLGKFMGGGRLWLTF